MLLAQSTSGVVRIVGDRYEVVDVGGVSLTTLLKSNSVALVGDASIIDVFDESDVTLLPPIDAPGKIIIVGLNYRDHAAEIGAPLPKVPRIFYTAPSAIVGPDDDIVLPAIAGAAVDFEGEMAVIIGTRASHASVDQAWTHVAGIAAANDVSARDVQDGSNPHIAGANVGLAKGFDAFKPLGPAILTRDDVLHQGRGLTLCTLVDGEIRQESSTSEMIHTVPELVSRISEYGTLMPGDVILTGTPGGVGTATGRFLSPGQVVEVHLEGVGVLRNRVMTRSAADRDSGGRSD